MQANAGHAEPGEHRRLVVVVRRGALVAQRQQHDDGDAGAHQLVDPGVQQIGVAALEQVADEDSTVPPAG